MFMKNYERDEEFFLFNLHANWPETAQSFEGTERISRWQMAYWLNVVTKSFGTKLSSFSSLHIAQTQKHFRCTLQTWR